MEDKEYYLINYDIYEAHGFNYCINYTLVDIVDSEKEAELICNEHNSKIPEYKAQIEKLKNEIYEIHREWVHSEEDRREFLDNESDRILGEINKLKYNCCRYNYSIFIKGHHTVLADYME